LPKDCFQPLVSRISTKTLEKLPTVFTRVAESEVFGWSRIPNNTGSGSRIFCPTPTPDVQLDHFLHHTPKLGIPVEMVQFLLKLLLKQISCCVPRLPLILTAKFHSLYVKESESEIWKCRSRESDILPLTPQPWYLPSCILTYSSKCRNLTRKKDQIYIYPNFL